jgi:hypothetical protein
MPKTIISVEKRANAKEPAPLTLVHWGRISRAGFTIVINPKAGHMAWF